jgi:hypothetical protein
VADSRYNGSNTFGSISGLVEGLPTCQELSQVVSDHVYTVY